MLESIFQNLWADRLLLSGAMAAALGVAAFVPYIRDILSGKTAPDRACWLIWAVLATLSGASNLYEGASASLLFVGVQVVGTLIVCALSVRFGSGYYWERGTLIVLTLAAFGIGAWMLTDTSAYALFIAISVSALGGVRTIWKAYLDPDSETGSAWAVLLASAAFGLLSVGTFDSILMYYPLYLLVLYGAVLIAMTLGRARGWVQNHASMSI